MNEEVMQQWMATAERLASAAESLDRVLGRLDAQQETLCAKVDRIVAAVDERSSYEPVGHEATRQLQERVVLEAVADLERPPVEIVSKGPRIDEKQIVLWHVWDPLTNMRIA